MSGLLPDRYPNRDFFILDVADAAPKDDMASMEHPLFSLSVKPDMRELSYETGNGEKLMIVPSGKGLATIMDKDILLYCISKLVNQLNRGMEISQTVELTAHEAMVATNWRTNKTSYLRFEDALDRLRGTTVKTNVKTGGTKETEGFGLIDHYKIVRRDDEGSEDPFGRMTRVEITLSPWTFRAVKSMEVLSISRDYFRLRRPLERRLYELARKHVGDQRKPFVIGIDKLQNKVGSNSPAKKFRFFLKEIIAADHLPDYCLRLDGDKVIFEQRKARRAPAQGQLDFGSDGIPRDPSPALLDKARRAAPGADIYMLYQEWRNFAREQAEPPRSVDAAFLGFCKKRREHNA